MQTNRRKTATTTLFLAALLVLEVALVVLLRTLGWVGTGNAFQLTTYAIVTVLPLLVVAALLAANRFRFGVRFLFFAITMVGVFLSVSLLPLLDYRSARRASIQLVSANATLNEGLDWDEFYNGIGLPRPSTVASSKSTNVPPWLTPFTKHISRIPPDDAVRSIWLNNDEQCQILADNWERFPSLLSVSVTRGVSNIGFRLLQDVLPRFKYLDSVHTNDVMAPPNWYGSLTNISMLWVWGEGASRGKPFPREHLNDIAALSNLEVVMVLGYAFNDSDAHTLSSSRSIKRIILRSTAVTSTGQSDLTDETSGRIVYRN